MCPCACSHGAYKWGEYMCAHVHAAMVRMLFIYFLPSGVGRLIAEAKTLPIVIPFWHVGMLAACP